MGYDQTCCGSECGCGTERKFLTNEEKIAQLEEYKTTLQTEAKGVQETIDRLKKR
jgi:hypothetical protein